MATFNHKIRNSNNKNKGPILTMRNLMDNKDYIQNFLQAP